MAGTLRFSGADTMTDLVAAWSQRFRAFHPDARIAIDGDSKLSAQGVSAVLEGRADLVTFVREPFTSEIDAFVRRTGCEPVLVNVAGGSYATRSGTHALAIYVNAANPISRLSLLQLDAILSKDRRRGQPTAIERWGQLGLGEAWAREPIHVYGMLHRRDSGNPPGIVNYLQKRVLLGGEFRDDIHEQIDKPGETALDAIVHAIAEDRFGIGYSGFAYAVKGTKSVALAENARGPFYSGTAAEVARRDYPLSREIYLGTACASGRPMSELLHEFLAFVLSREGQQAVAADHMHFIPLSAAQAATARRALDP